MTPDLSIIIVNFNTGRWLRDVLRSVFHRVQGVVFEVLVVDNGSIDGSLDGLPEKFPQIKVIRNRKNLGFAKAVNRGIKRSLGRYVLLLNPDTTLLNQGWAQWLRQMDEHPRVGIAGAKVYDDETRRSVQLSCRRFPSLMNYFFNRHSLLTRLCPGNRFSNRYLMSDWDHTKPSDVDWVSGCCMLLRREMLDDIGLLDEGYPMFSEDVDVCYRARQAGWRVRYMPEVEIAHHTGSIRAQAGTRTQIERHQSLWRFCRKFYGKRRGLSAVVLLGIVARLGLLLGLTALKRIMPWLIDAGLIQLSVGLAFAARHAWEFLWTQRALDSYLDVAIWYTLIQLFLLYLFDLYRRSPARYDDYLDILPQTIKAVSLGTIMLVFTAFFDRQFVLPRSIVVFSWGFNIVLLTGWRWLALYGEQKNLHHKRVLIYGTGVLAALVEDELNRRISLQYRPLGFIRPLSGGAAAVAPARVLGALEDLMHVVRQQRIDEIVFAPETCQDQELETLMKHCDAVHINTRLAPDLFETTAGNTNLTHFQVPYLDPERRPNHRVYTPLKRTMDFAGAVLLLFALLPLMALIALKRKFEGLPVLIRQPRVGLNGEAFSLYKFGKTRDARDEENLFRMTPFGRFLRLTRLDELPQLFNVLKGDMSLVGPQAEMVEVARELGKNVPFFMQRHRVRPGMTGWAQVEMRYATSADKYQEKLQYDLYYIKNMSLALDFKILLKSIWMVITGRGVR